MTIRSALQQQAFGPVAYGELDRSFEEDAVAAEIADGRGRDGMVLLDPEGDVLLKPVRQAVARLLSLVDEDSHSAFVRRIT